MSTVTPESVTWEFSTPADPATTWALFSDTERYNRAVGFGFDFTESPRADGTTERRGSAVFLGIKMTWIEAPFQYGAPRWYRWERVFDSGPAERLVGTLRLKPQGDGTAILYRIDAFPRYFFFRPAVAFEVHVRSKPKMTVVLEKMVQSLDGEVVTLDPLPPALSAETTRRLDTMLGRVSDREISTRIHEFIDETPLHEQLRISPLALAERWRLPRERVLTACLDAVQQGVFTLSWELLCPLCLGAKGVVAALGDAGRQVHCAACNISYDASFPDAVGVTLQTSSAIRPLQGRIECIGSPARQPHVVAQDFAEPGARVTFEVDLQPGLYRVRSVPNRGSTSLSVGETGPLEASLTLSGDQLSPNRVLLGSGKSWINIANPGKVRLQLVLERRSLAPYVLTAGQLLETPGAAALLPPEAIGPDLRSETSRQAIVAVEPADPSLHALEAERKHLLAHQPRQLRMRDGRLVATFLESDAAVAAACGLVGRGGLVGLAAGPVVELTLASGVVFPAGPAVERAFAALQGAFPERIAMSAADADEPDLLKSVVSRGGVIEPERHRVADGLEVAWMRIV